MIKIVIKTSVCSVLLCSLLLSDPAKDNEQRMRQKEIFESLNKNPLENIEHMDISSFNNNSSLMPSYDNTTCFDINNIDVSGITLLGRYSVESVVSNYLNKCNSLSDLKHLTDELSALYIQEGYITSQVYLSPQNIASGTVLLKALEGKVSEIYPKSLSTYAAFLGQRENYLNIRDIEAALDSINRISSNHAVMNLNPSNKTGYTDIVVDNSPTKRFGGSIGIDNYGGKQTGRAQVSGRVNFDNIFGVNDQLNILLNSSNKHFTDEDSMGNGYDYSFALGRTSFTFSQKNSKFDQKVKSGTSTFYSRGRTKTYTFGTQYGFYHDKSSRFNLGASLSNYRTRNYFADIYLETSSYRLSKLSLSTDYVYQIPGFYAYVGLSYTKGVNIFNNYHATELDDNYEFYNISLSAMKEFSIFKYSMNAYSQFAKDALFGADRMSIGGPYSIRGFQKEGLSGNSGYYIRNELSYDWDVTDGISNSLFLAVDGGAIKSDDESFGGKLLGYSVGTKFQSNNFEASLHYAIPAYKKDVEKTSKFLGLSLRAKF
jgi:hemolysin activation/secretion protein